LAQHTGVGLQSPGENRGTNSTTIIKFDRVKEILEKELAYDKKDKRRGAERSTQWRNELVEAKKTIRRMDPNLAALELGQVKWRLRGKLGRKALGTLSLVEKSKDYKRLMMTQLNSMSTALVRETKI